MWRVEGFDLICLEQWVFQERINGLGIQQGLVLGVYSWRGGFVVSSLGQSKFLDFEFFQIDVLLFLGKWNCFLEVRNKKRLEVNFNLGV